jgi:hypothetical protein
MLSALTIFSARGSLIPEELGSCIQVQLALATSTFLGAICADSISVEEGTIGLVENVIATSIANKFVCHQSITQLHL